jgi:hypothetical protein
MRTCEVVRMKLDETCHAFVTGGASVIGLATA